MFANLREKFNEKIKTLSAPEDPLEKRIVDLVDRATSDVLIGPDWGTNMELVDVVNSDPRQTLVKATRALRRSLQTGNAKVQMLALTVVETFIKNCTRSFHRHFINSDLFNEMLRIAQAPTGQLATSEVKDRILCLIEDLAKALAGPYQEAYESLLDSGVDFPVRAAEDIVPLEIPADVPEPSSSLADISEEDRIAIQEAMRDLETEARQRHQLRARGQQEQGEQQGTASPPSGDPASRGATDPAAPPTAAATPGATTEPAAALPLIPGTSPEEVIQAAAVSQEVLDAALSSIPATQPEGVKEAYIGEVAAQCRAQRAQLANVVETCTDETLLAQALTVHESLQRTIEQYNSLLVRTQSASLAVSPVGTNSTTSPATSPAPYAAPQFTISEEDEVDESLVTSRSSGTTAPVPILAPPPSATPAQFTAPDLIDLGSESGSPEKQPAALAGTAAAPAAGAPAPRTADQVLAEMDRLVLENPGGK